MRGGELGLWKTRGAGVTSMTRTLGKRSHQLLRRVREALARLEQDASGDLGDFTANWRIIPMSVAAVAIGVLSAYVALALLRLIGLFTNLFFFQRWDTALV